jgi:hypothetical protein
VSKVSAHAKRRIRERVGTRAVKKLSDAALREGVTLENTKGRLRDYLLYLQAKPGTRVRLFKNRVFIYRGANTLVTVVNLPWRILKYVKAQQPKEGEKP